MILALPVHVQARLETIHRLEGIPPLEAAHQAIEIWSSLTATERQALGLAALQLVAMRRSHPGDHS